MPIDTITLLIALTSLNLLALGALALWIRAELDAAVVELDSALALAIKATMDQLGDGVMGGFDQVNPVQAAIAQMIQAYASNKITTIEGTASPRGADGTFQKGLEEFE
jgi:hypothetical protein|tara:strand:+ start:113 stop:436 length:324 start_codon:yes stop_codon:yes gene_type:complete